MTRKTNSQAAFSRIAFMLRRSAMILVAALLAAALAPLKLCAQDAEKPKPNYQTIYLHNMTTSNDINDVATALRNMFPSAAMYADMHIGAIVMRGSSFEIEHAQKMVIELDHARRTWRLTYTVTEIDNSKPTTPQHYTLTVAEGAKAFLKQGTKVPIVTGKYDTDKSTGPETQVQYQDVGLGIDIALDGYQDGLRLHTKFEQSAVANDTGAHADDPVISQTTMETTSALVPGKEVSLGSVAEPNSPHHVSVSVIAEAVK
jgi:type II secretory pathway component GspD/PulD (secretin)